MPDRTRSSRPRDINQLGTLIVDSSVGEMVDECAIEAPKEKNPAAVSLGRLGGRKGGRARAEKLSPERRREIAQQAAFARYGRKQ